ncbi:hypothetical protein AAFF_G00137170 [Aldrovandia affinis]|uniref:Kinase non-catalytic C-lobe domain-containing protein 1 n=1 Tax=Aldrovandia affinis TaxID=143900 RepID=A0AAD7TCZ6_9TELE|nr:hypothetical protein AAFF_G00137170 [Aldrovandia affinis]
MGTFETAVSAYYEEEEEDEEAYYEFEPLPALLEDEENVSLADILSLRDTCLSEPEVWAVCLECVLALQSIAHSPLFQTLCITPDTLAFNAHGNVSFMEQLSDDPEGSFMPPEFDSTGNTVEGHVFSLGATLAAALDFVIEPELEPELGPEIRRLLEQMQQEMPSDRPGIQDIVTLGAGQLQQHSSMSICRKLSAIGRRVLSIESVGAFCDGLEGSWAVQQQLRRARRRSSSDPEDVTSVLRNHTGDCVEGDMQSVPHTGHFSPCREGPQSHGLEEAPFEPWSDSRSQNSSPVRKALGRSGRSRAVLNRSSSVPDSNNPPAHLPLHVNRNIPLTNLTEIGAEESVADAIARNGGLCNGDRNPAAEYHDPNAGVWAERGGNAGTLEFLRSSLDGNRNLTEKFHRELSPEVSLRDGVRNLEDCPDPTGSDTTMSNSMYSPSNHMTKSMLCLNEETQDEWISLRELLSWYCQPLSVNELWALCYTCLSTLQTYIDFPGSCDPFFLAPEFQEHGIVTEKVCVYGVAAIIWATAKFSLSPNQKLAMPRKLKRLLLEMAKRIPMERPSIVMAKKSCRDYLNHQGATAEVVWAKLIHRAHQAHLRDCSAESLDNMKMENQEESSQIKIGFMPCTGESGLSAVQGPVPHGYSVSADPHLPVAFTSPATHFTPIVLTRDGATEGKGGAQGPGAEGLNNGYCTSEPRSQHECETPGGDQPELPLYSVDSLGKRAEKGEGEHHHLIIQETGALRDCSSTSSSGKTLVNSLSPSSPAPTHTDQEIASLPLQFDPASSCPSATQSTGSFGSFLLRQDPRTGLLTLFPVQISVPEPIPGLDLGLPSFSTSLLGQQCWTVGQSGSALTAGGSTNRRDYVTVELPGGAQTPPAPSPQSHAFLPTGCHRKRGDGEGGDSRVVGGAPRVSSEPTPTQQPPIHPSLQGVIDLVRDEFAFQGYLENGVEDRAMGEYIFSLRDLQYDTFRSAVSEKYCDLYWDEKLLNALYHMINKTESPRDPSCIRSSNTQPPSKSQQRPARSPADRERREGGGVGVLSGDGRECGPLEPRARREAVSDALGCRGCAREAEPSDTRDSAERPSTPGLTCLPASQNKETAEEPPQHGLPDIDTPPTPVPKEANEGGGMAEGEMDSGECPVGGAVETSSDVESPLLTGVGEASFGRGQLRQLSRDYSEDMEDTDSLTSTGGPQDDGRPLGAEGRRCTQGWALSFYGEEYFKEDVLSYAKKLGQRSESPSLEAKTQELHQQLTIESRNLKKTRNFYHKLLHQERKNKGSDSKIMMSKIKAQLEEMKSKVDFLDAVRKYLEVLFVDQWGLDVPLLPSLAVSGPAPLELRPSEDPSVLTFQPGTGRGRGTPAGTTSLQAGTPLGLMSYLYARNAPLEGYIQQFLYTYRYFCTPEEFLQFLIDKFISVTGDSREPSAERSKVHHRTLDLLQAWLEDSRQVDFLPKSGLQQSLEEFLTSQVIPMESRGEALLALLQSPPRKRRSHVLSGCCGSPISIQEEDDAQSVRSLCRKSSTEDSGRKGFQWRISRVVEPQSLSSSCLSPKRRRQLTLPTGCLLIGSASLP